MDDIQSIPVDGEWDEGSDSRLLSFLREKSDGSSKKFYKVDMKKFDYSRIARKLERDVDSVYQRLQFLTKSVTKYKSFQQICGEALESLKDIREASQNPSGAEIYFKNEWEKIRLEHEQLGSEEPIFDFFVRDYWPKVSADVKKRYTRAARSSKSTTNQFRDILALFKEINPTLSHVEAVSKLKNIKPKKRLIIITKLVEEYKTHLDEEEPSNIRIKVSQNDFSAYFRSLGLPEEHPRKDFTFWYKETHNDDADKENIMGQLRMFKELSEKKRVKYIAKFNESYSQYKENFEAWKSSLDSLNLKLYNSLYRKIGKEKKNLLENYTTVVMPFIKVSAFPGEPMKPPKNGLQLFTNLEKKKGIKVKEGSAFYAKLDTKTKSKLKMKAAELKKKYIENLLSFVNNLPDSTRYLYLGSQRMTLYELLKVDIFRDLYPHEIYPVYVDSPPSIEKSTNSEDNSAEAESTARKVHKRVKKSPKAATKSKKAKVADSSENDLSDLDVNIKTNAKNQLTPSKKLHERIKNTPKKSPFQPPKKKLKKAASSDSDSESESSERESNSAPIQQKVNSSVSHNKTKPAESDSDLSSDSSGPSLKEVINKTPILQNKKLKSETASSTSSSDDEDSDSDAAMKSWASRH